MIREKKEIKLRVVSTRLSTDDYEMLGKISGATKKKNCAVMSEMLSKAIKREYKERFTAMS
jgi:hypothetical protein